MISFWGSTRAISEHRLQGIQNHRTVARRHASPTPYSALLFHRNRRSAALRKSARGLPFASVAFGAQASRTAIDQKADESDVSWAHRKPTAA